MNDKQKTLVINTMTESKYMELSAAGKISNKQLNIVDNDDVGRTVIASYDLVNEKIENNQLSLNYDADGKRVQLIDAAGNERSAIDASDFLKDGMLNGIEYRADDENGGALWFTVSAEGGESRELSVEFVDTVLLSASSNAVQNKTVYSGLSSLRVKTESIDKRLSDVEADYVRYTAVPTQDKPERKAIILKNGDLLTGKTRDGTADRHLIGIAGSDRDIINVGASGIQLNLNTASYDCGALGTLNAINVNGGTDFVMTNGSMPAAIVGDGNTVNVQTREIAVPLGVNVKQLVISTDAESKANSYTDSEISKLSAEVSTVYQTKADSQTSAAALDIRLTNIEDDYLISADKNELQGKIDEKADSTTLVQVSSDLSTYADSVGENAIQSANEYTNSVSGEIRTDLNDLSGTVVAIQSDYALSSEVSSKAELEEEFKKYQLSGNYLSVEVFENTISDYALSSEVSSKTELSEKFNAIDEKFNDYYTSAQTSSSNELAEEFKKYQLSGDYLSVETFESTIKLSVENLVKEIATKTIAITDETTSEGYLKSYTISQGGAQISVIDIPKDFLVKSGDVKTCEQPDTPVSGYAPGDKYLDFVVNVASGEADDQHIYINVKDLTDIYKGADGEEISVGVDSSNNIGAVIKAGAVTKEKINNLVYAEISSIASAYVENGINGLDSETTNEDASKTISKITENNGLVSARFTPILIEKTQVNGLTSELNGLNDKFQDYYQKTQTSSAEELSDAFDGKQDAGDYLSCNALDDYYTKSETSAIVSNRLYATDAVPQYVTSGREVYQAGDMATLDGHPWVCLCSDVSGSWDSSKWNRTTLYSNFAKKSEIPGVVKPSTALSAEGKSADAKAVGEALELKSSEIKDSEKTIIGCMWNAISAHAISSDGQLKPADQLSVDDIMNSFLNMAANLSAIWTQLNT